jgi:environmental stress-induced protein Ves
MNWNLVHLSDVAPVPWRNGGGVTRELAVSPAQGDWHWRMSVAEVDGSGPFSRFEGIDRWFAVLEGAGVRLDVQGEVKREAHRITRNSAPFYFDGGAPTHCTLVDGRTQDFNLMVRRGSTPARMLRINAPTNFVLGAPKIIAVYAMNTETNVLFDSKLMQIPPQSLAWACVPAGAGVEVVSENALWMEIPV